MGTRRRAAVARVHVWDLNGGGADRRAEHDASAKQSRILQAKEPFQQLLAAARRREFVGWTLGMACCVECCRAFKFEESQAGVILCAFALCNYRTAGQGPALCDFSLCDSSCGTGRIAVV